MKPILAKSEELRTIWTHKLLALGTIIPRPHLPSNQSLDTATHEPDIVRQQAGSASQIEVNTAATWAGTRDRIFYCALDRETFRFTRESLLRGFSNDLAGPNIDPFSLIVPVCCLIDLFKLWKRRAILVY